MAPQATERARAELRAFNQDYELLAEVANNPVSAANHFRTDNSYRESAIRQSRQSRGTTTTEGNIRDYISTQQNPILCQGLNSASHQGKPSLYSSSLH